MAVAMNRTASPWIGVAALWLCPLGVSAIGQAPTWVNPADGQVMVLVPAGEFTIGNEGGPQEEHPTVTLYVPAFYIGRTEVTVAEFRRFVHDSGCDAGVGWQERAQNGNWPVTSVTWLQARAYCDWAGLRLPTEAEWEKAARGTDGRKWPWGSEWVAGAANVGGAEDGFAEVAPVGSFPTGASPFGCLDLAGNVWEWTASLYRPYPYAQYDGRENYAAPGSRVVRGGGWTDDASRARTTVRFEGHADGFGPNMGFRCAVSVPVPVTLSTTDADVRSTLTQLFEARHRRCVLDDSVHGTVSVNVTGMPFEAAVNAVLSAASLSYRLENGVYRITGAPPPEKTDHIALATAAVDGLLRHFWVGDEATGHVLPTYAGRGDPKPPDQRGILWERATFVSLLESLFQVTRDPALQRRIAAEWRSVRDQFSPAELESCGGGSQNPACDDAGWSALMYLRIYRATQDPEALARARGLVLNSLDRWTDHEFGGGLWYRDGRDGKSSVQAALILAALWVAEVARDRALWDRAAELAEWCQEHLLRSDGLYWWWYWRGGPERYWEPRSEGVSDTFLGANMAVAVIHARLYGDTGQPVYLQRALCAADAVVAGETDGKGALLNDRDAWANGYFMGEWVREVVPLPDAEREYAQVIRRTAQAVWERARTPDGYFGACWNGPAEGTGCPWSSPGIPIRSSKSFPEQIMTSSCAANVIVAAAQLDALGL